MFIVLFTLIPDNKSDVADQIIDKITQRDFINKGGLIPLEWVWHKGQQKEQGGHGHAHRVYHHGVTLGRLPYIIVTQSDITWLLTISGQTSSGSGTQTRTEDSYESMQ